MIPEREREREREREIDRYGKRAPARCYCSACSGLIGASLGTPLDVVKTRVMNQPTDVRARWVMLYSPPPTCCRHRRGGGAACPALVALHVVGKWCVSLAKALRGRVKK